MFIAGDYYDAEQWLQGSRRIIDRDSRRTIYSGYYRLVMVRRSPETIAITAPWLTLDICTYNKDGTMILDAGTHAFSGSHILNSQGTRRLITALAGFTSLYQRKRKFYIIEKNYKLTTSKIQGCRQCSSSGKINMTCYPTVCYEGYNKGACSSHNESINGRGTHMVPCEHGKTNYHTLYKGQACYFCNGKGVREYGLKPIALMWDGSPIRIKNGNLVKKEPSELEKRIAAYVNPFD